jgi:hypothetical protein
MRLTFEILDRYYYTAAGLERKGATSMNETRMSNEMAHAVWLEMWAMLEDSIKQDRTEFAATISNECPRPHESRACRSTVSGKESLS